MEVSRISKATQTDGRLVVARVCEEGARGNDYLIYKYYLIYKEFLFRVIKMFRN